MWREHQEEHARACPFVAAQATISALEAEVAALRKEMSEGNRERDRRRVVARPERPVLSAKDGPTKLERRALAENSCSSSPLSSLDSFSSSEDF